jgi:hypothetical protein
MILGPIEQGTIPRGVYVSPRRKIEKNTFVIVSCLNRIQRVELASIDAMSFTKVDTPAGTLPAMIVQKCHNASKEVGMCAQIG